MLVDGLPPYAVASGLHYDFAVRVSMDVVIMARLVRWVDLRSSRLGGEHGPYAVWSKYLSANSRSPGTMII